MTDQELRIARLSKIMNSGLRIQTGNRRADQEAYQRAVSSLQRALDLEKNFNFLQEKKKKLLEKADREQELLKESIYKHHLKVLQQQIEEKKQNRQIQDKEAILEKELTEESYRPKKINIKQMLDAQIEEKKRIDQEKREKEAAVDRLRLELASKSLDLEMKNKSDGKKKLQNQLRESWEKTKETNKLQKAIDRLRRFGDNYVIDSEEDEVGEINEGIIARKYQNSKNATFGMEDSFSRKVINRKRSKSSLSKTSHISAVIRLKKLEAKEQKIKEKKENIVEFLESRSHSKISNRSISVTPVFSKIIEKRSP